MAAIPASSIKVQAFTGKQATVEGDGRTFAEVATERASAEEDQVDHAREATRPKAVAGGRGARR